MPSSTLVPEISINKLAEFVAATSNRKKSILKTIKTRDAEASSKRNRYSTAKSAITSFFQDDEHDMAVFEKKRNLLMSRKTDSPQQQNDIKNSLAAIRLLEEMARGILQPYLRFDSIKGLPKEKRNKLINGVFVRFSPDIILLSNGEIAGAVKLVFSKAKPLTPLQGQIIAGLIHRHLEKEFKVTINHRNCFALDVFSRRIHPVPDSFTYYSTLLKKAYTEINKLWPSIK